MNPVLQQILIVVVTYTILTVSKMLYFRWTNNVTGPTQEIAAMRTMMEQWKKDTRDELSELNEKLVKVRTSNAKIRGILNGHGWKISPEED